MKWRYKALFKKPPCDPLLEMDYWRNKYYLLLEEHLLLLEKKLKKSLKKRRKIA
jgi:hypothetical protein